jgi:hypothetical protein
MTIVTANILKSGTSDPLSGFIRVRTATTFALDGTLVVVSPVDFPLVNDYLR